MLRGVTELQVRRIHPAWWVAAVTFLALVGAAGFRSVPGVFMDPLREEFGWSVTTISTAFSVNMALYGLTSPFAAALMERFGIRAVVTAAGSGPEFRREVLAAYGPEAVGGAALECSSVLTQALANRWGVVPTNILEDF